MKLEIRSGGEIVVSGYVNAVERDSRILPQSMSPKATKRFVERIRAKTFERALSKGNPVELRFNHGRTIATTADGTLKLKEDNIGLYAEAVIKDPEVIAEARNLKGWSFGFFNPKDIWEEAPGDMQRRTIDDFDLKEVSILTKTPAYVGTSIEFRGEETETVESRGFEEPAVIEEQKPDYSAKKKEIEILKLRRSV